MNVFGNAGLLLTNRDKQNKPTLKVSLRALIFGAARRCNALCGRSRSAYRHAHDLELSAIAGGEEREASPIPRDALVETRLSVHDR